MNSAAKRLKILVVDDEPDIQIMLQDMLTAAGYKVDVASNGVEAFERMFRARPDIVLLDVHFPGYLNGIDVCRRIKKNPAYRDTQVIIMTADPDRESVVNAIKAGAAEYVVKPFVSNVLKKKIESTLLRARGENPSPESTEPGSPTPVQRPRGSGLAASRAARETDNGIGVGEAECPAGL